MQKLIDFIQLHDGICDKETLAKLVCERFHCAKKGCIYYTGSFAIRFCKGSANASNTVLGLSVLLKYDDRPVIVCICGTEKNHLLLANTTMLSKISHSSKTLRVDYIRGSFNAPNILRSWGGITNVPENFSELFAIHQNISWKENLIRLVEATNNIVPTGQKFDVSVGNRLTNIMQAPERAVQFVASAEYLDLLNDLDARTKAHENEILAAASIDNVNLRGRTIEHMISSKGETSVQLITRNGLGDYTKYSGGYHVETDIKTKRMDLASMPKGYNLDKVLEFLSREDSVFMLYIVGVDNAKKSIKTKLVSMFQSDLLDHTLVQSHWSGRNSRGASQLRGNAIKRIIASDDHVIDLEKAKDFLEGIAVM